MELLCCWKKKEKKKEGEDEDDTEKQTRDDINASSLIQQDRPEEDDEISSTDGNDVTHNSDFAGKTPKTPKKKRKHGKTVLMITAEGTEVVPHHVSAVRTPASRNPHMHKHLMWEERDAEEILLPNILELFLKKKKEIPFNSSDASCDISYFLVTNTGEYQRVSSAPVIVKVTLVDQDGVRVGPIVLGPPLGAKRKFCPCQQDLFRLDVRESDVGLLGPLAQLLIDIRSNNKTTGKWFLESAIVRRISPSTYHEWKFPFKQWVLSTDGHDADLRRGKGRTYFVCFATGFAQATWSDVTLKKKKLKSGAAGGNTEEARHAEEDRGISLVVQLELIGDSSASRKWRLRESREHGKNILKTHSRDTFEVVLPSKVGSVQQMRLHVSCDKQYQEAVWLLQSVTVVDKKTHSSTLMHCGRWITVSETETCHVLLKTEAEVPGFVYRVKMVVSTMKRDVNELGISICLRSDTDETEWLLLESYSPADSKRGQKLQVIQFSLWSVRDVGPLVEIGIRHDGFPSAWFLHRFEILIPGVAETWKAHTFEWNDWIDEFGTEFTISKILVQRGYQIQIYPSPHSPPASMSISLQLLGMLHFSEVVPVSNGDDGLCSFAGGGLPITVEVPSTDIGILESLILNIAGAPAAAIDWTISKIKVTSPAEGSTSGQSWEIFANRLVNEFVSKICLPVGSAAASMTKFVIKAHTCLNWVGGGTADSIYISLFGSGPLDALGTFSLAPSSPKSLRFVPGTTDVWEISTVCAPFERLEFAEISYSGPATWHLGYLDVSVKISDKKSKSWQFLGMQDMQPGNTICRMTPGLVKTYTVHVKTGNVNSSGTDGAVSVEFIGSNGSRSLRHNLRVSVDGRTGKALFAKGQHDSFAVVSHDLGVITSCVVYHNSSSAAQWYLESVVVECVKEGMPWTFSCRRWFLPDVTEMELTEGSEEVYEVAIQTGDEDGGGTDAQVTLEMFGSLDTSGMRVLSVSKEGRINLFERNQKDTFEVVSRDLGTVHTIMIGQDGSGLGSAWFVENVWVTQSNGEQLYFPARRWLSGKCFEVSLQSAVFGREVEYEVNVKTGGFAMCGTSCAYISIYGDRGDSSLVVLMHGDSVSLFQKKSFESNQTDSFSITMAQSLGSVSRIALSHHPSNLNSNWFLERIELATPEGEILHFFAHSWIGPEEELTLHPLPSHKYFRYLLAVETVDCRFGSILARTGVYVQLFGTEGETLCHVLLNTVDGTLPKVESNLTDCFEIESPQFLGEITKIQLGIDGGKMTSLVKWSVGNVDVSGPSLPDSNSNEKFSIRFPCAHALTPSTPRIFLEKGKPIATSSAMPSPPPPQNVAVVSMNKMETETPPNIIAPPGEHDQAVGEDKTSSAKTPKKNPRPTKMSSTIPPTDARPAMGVDSAPEQTSSPSVVRSSPTWAQSLGTLPPDDTHLPPPSHSPNPAHTRVPPPPTILNQIFGFFS